MDAKALIIMGRFGAPFGVKGEVKVQSFSEPPDAMLDYQPWYYETDQGFKPVPLEAARFQAPHIIARLADCHDRDAAKRWTHCTIAVARDTLPTAEEDEYYWSDLEGVSVFTADGEHLGIVSTLFATGANDVMVVTAGEKRHLIPFMLDRVIKQVDLKNRTLIVDWDVLE